MISFTAEDRILVTGASSGIGAACAVLLNGLGATVIGVGRAAEKLKETQSCCANPALFHAEPKDLTDNVSGLSDWVKGIREKYGKLRGCLSCAGVVEVVPTRMQHADGMKALFEINFFSAYQLARAFLDRRNNMGEQSALVFIASDATIHNNAGISSYAASKGALVSAARSLACEYLSQHIRVNCVSPGLTATPMTQGNAVDFELRAQAYPWGTAQPDDIAHVAAFLLSPSSRWITGQNLLVDGGSSLL